MRLTTRTRYALRALIDLANLKESQTTSLQMMARRQRVKPKYLEQILIRLRQANIIGGRKGPGGGYFLKKAPKKTTLLNIMNAVGESLAPVSCTNGKPDKYCSRKRHCILKSCWKKLDKVILDFVASYSLKDIMKG